MAAVRSSTPINSPAAPTDLHRRVDDEVDTEAVTAQLHRAESTRNGISSLTLWTTVCVDCQPRWSKRGL
jgi:hypothetical protein